MQQEGFQLSYDLSQAANLLRDAAPYLVNTQGDIWRHVADRLPFTPENLYFIQSLEVDFLDDFVKKHSAYNAVVGLGGGPAADIAKYLQWNEALALETRKRLALILDNAAEIRDVSDKGVTLLAETLNWICHHYKIES